MATRGQRSAPPLESDVSRISYTRGEARVLITPRSGRKSAPEKKNCRQYRLYLHRGPGHTPAERGPSLESIYQVSLTVDLCEG